MQADTIIRNGRVVNVYSGEILRADVAIRDGRILHVGDVATKGVAPESIYDAAGDYLIPGFFDGHAHMDLFYNPFAYARCVLPRGTTCIFNDGHDLAAAVGVDAFLDIVAGLQHGPMTIKSGAPAATPPYPEVEGEDLWSMADFSKAMACEDILSVSETVAYLRVVHRDPNLLERFTLARLKGKLIEGHTTGANWDRLNALAYGGVLSCHESLSSADVISRLRLGFYVMLRHGSIREDMPKYIEAVHAAEAFDTSRIMLVSDGIFADHLIERGNMDWVVAEAVRHGIAPVRAIQMATLNPARYFRLDHEVGAIAPGRLAHILVTSSLERPTPRLVFAKGKPVAEEGRLLTDAYHQVDPVAGSRPFEIADIHPDRFRVAARPGLTTVPVITIVNRTVTGSEEAVLPVQNGFYAPPDDILPAFLISRDGLRTGCGFVKGYPRGLGGLASTVSHDTHGLLVIGSNPSDMALAAAEALQPGGGVVFVQNGGIRASIPLPLGGHCSLKAVPELAAEIRHLNREIESLGTDLDNPLWTLVFLTFTSVLQLRLTYAGVYDVRRGKIVF